MLWLEVLAYLLSRLVFGEPGAFSGVTRCCGGERRKKRRMAAAARAGVAGAGDRVLVHFDEAPHARTAARAPRPGVSYEMAPAHGCPRRSRRRYNLAQRLVLMPLWNPHRCGPGPRAFYPSPPRCGRRSRAREDAWRAARSLGAASLDGRVEAPLRAHRID